MDARAFIYCAPRCANCGGLKSEPHLTRVADVAWFGANWWEKQGKRGETTVVAGVAGMFSVGGFRIYATFCSFGVRCVRSAGARGSEHGRETWRS